MNDVIGCTYKELGNAGRLGNQLFQVANTAAQSLIAGSGVVGFRQDWEYQDYIQVPREWFSRTPRELASLTDLSFDSKGHTDYLQNLDFNKYIDLRVAMCFTPDVFNEVWSGMNPNFVSNSIAIHLRCGDYDKHRAIFPLPSKEYYLKGQEMIMDKAIIRPTQAIIYSDDIERALDHIPIIEGLDIVIPELGGSVESPVPGRRSKKPTDHLDMAAMAISKFGIISNSTYSWWAGVMRGYVPGLRLTVYPTDWYAKGRPENKNVKKIFHPQWMGIDNKGEVNANPT